MEQKNRIFVISDIHGHYIELMHLYKKIISEGDFKPEKDTLITIGDMVDGGPDTKKVINQLMAWEKKYPHWVFLYGNHEDLMLDALIGHQKNYGDFYLWFNQGGKATVDSYKNDIVYKEGLVDYEKALLQPEDIIPVEHLDWIRQRPWWYEDDAYFFVHAGLTPQLSIEENKNDDPKGIKQEMLWIREEFIESHDDWRKKVIFGHTPTKEPIIMKNKIGIDTMYQRNAGRLCALELPTEKFYFQKMITKPSF